MSLPIEHLPLEVRSEIDRLQREVESLRGALKKAKVALMAEHPTLHDRVDAAREALRSIKECGVE